jgi:hypothetical protein
LIRIAGCSGSEARIFAPCSHFPEEHQISHGGLHFHERRFTPLRVIVAPCATLPADCRATHAVFFRSQA